MTVERNKVPATRGLEELEKLLSGKTQKQLSTETGITQSVISEILNQWRLPTLEQAIKLQEHGIEPAAWADKSDAA